MVWAQGSRSTLTESDGLFELSPPRVDDLVLHGSADGSLVGVLTEIDDKERVRLALSPGATLEVTVLGGKRHRCAVYHGGNRIEDFTLRPNEGSSVVVPAGEVRLLVYDGAETLSEDTITVESGERQSLVYDLRE